MNSVTVAKAGPDSQGPSPNAGQPKLGRMAVDWIFFCDLAGLMENSGANSGMRNVKSSRGACLQPLETGQMWRMAELNLRVGMVGKLLVHYKLAKPNAVRTPNSVSPIATVEKYLKKNKAVLVRE
jgi:hypothetical protein